jgi:hypothetical protein
LVSLPSFSFLGRDVRRKITMDGEHHHWQVRKIPTRSLSRKLHPIVFCIFLHPEAI